MKNLSSLHERKPPSGEPPLRPPLILHLPSPGRPIQLPASMRLPVTPGNRDYLRALRAAEMIAWELAMPFNTRILPPMPGLQR
jgi:hypothetical protein